MLVEVRNFTGQARLVGPCALEIALPQPPISMWPAGISDT